jgi:hypothetical protein
MEHRKVGIQDTEQDDEEKRGEEFIAVAVNIQMGFAIRPPSNRLAVSREHVSARWFCWPLASIRDGSLVPFQSFHYSPLECFCIPKSEPARRGSEKALSVLLVEVKRATETPSRLSYFASERSSIPIKATWPGNVKGVVRL